MQIDELSTSQKLDTPLDDQVKLSKAPVVQSSSSAGPSVQAPAPAPAPAPTPVPTPAPIPAT
eukprot:3947386-Karenia_brevis.AAC.1